MKIKINCGYCEKEILRELSWFNQTQKRGEKSYCSKGCRDRAMSKKRFVKCAKCQKDVLISNKSFLSSKSGRFFCSHSCAAKYNNRGVRRHGYFVKKECLGCGTITKNRKFCGHECEFEYGRKQRREQIEKTGKIEFGVEEYNRRIAKTYLIEVRGRSCEICGGKEWMGLPMPIVLDHKDGDAQNYAVNNLRLVCGNCNMQLSTFAGRNKGKGTRGKKPHI